MKNQTPSLGHGRIAAAEPVTILFFIFYFLLSNAAFSADEFTEISSESLEYFSQSNAIVARGSVKIRFKDSTLSADEMRLNSNTRDAVVTGNVIFRDSLVDISADKIEVNLDTKLGTMYGCDIFYRKHNFHLRSSQLSKVGEKSFFLDRARVTTCDADPPEWHLTARDISITQHESVRGRAGSFNIGSTPIFYIPYFWASLSRDRETGFLFPSFGYSSERGYYYKQGFFWAIEENQDATVYLDYYGKKGFGEGIDYRYILSPSSEGELWLYHVRDNDPARNLGEIKSYHNEKLSGNLDAYVKLHGVTHHDYYETMDSTSLNRFGLSTWDLTRFGLASEERLQKYLESDIHISRRYENGRAYFLAQGRQSLEESSRKIPQSLPEIGYVLTTQSEGVVSYELGIKAVNFWREQGQEAIRFDVYPNLYFSYGRLFNITQRVGLRETVYFLTEPNDYRNRLIYDLDTTLTTKLYRKYTSYIHIIEPSLRYTNIPHVDHTGIPFFDLNDEVEKTNSITYSLTNRLSGLTGKNLESRFRLSQTYSFLDGEKDFSPLLAEATLVSDRVGISVNASYDVEDNLLAEFIGLIQYSGKRGFWSVGKNLRRSTDLDQYTFAAGLYRPLALLGKNLPVDLRSKVWYDIKNGRIQELNASISYKKQCWGYSIAYNEVPDDYQIIFAVEFTGLGTFSLGSI